MDDEQTKVKVTGFDVPLNDVIGLMLKVGVALIPVSIVLGLFYALVFVLFSSMNGCGLETKGKPPAECPDDWTVVDACNSIPLETATGCHACAYDYGRCKDALGPHGVWHQSEDGAVFAVVPGSWCTNGPECLELCQTIETYPAECFEKEDCIEGGARE